MTLPDWVPLPHDTALLVAGVAGLLALSSLVTAVLARVPRLRGTPTIANLRQRVNAWWWMVGILVAAASLGHGVSVALFGVLSFLALREAVTLSPTRRGDHRTLFWAFFVIVPAQYALVAADWYGLFAIFIPVWAFLFVAVRSAVASDVRAYHERSAKIQWALMVCVYFVSHAPMLLTMPIPGFEGRGLNLLFWLATVVQLSDVFQYVWGKLCGRHAVAPLVSPSKTWEGAIGGIATATGIGAALWWMTPFSPLAAAGLAAIVCFAGFCGGLAMSAVKRDAGLKDWGASIPGHGGIMDRIDSLCFAAPVFYHLVRYWYAEPWIVPAT